MRKETGQASLELTVVLIVFILFLIAGVRTFLWLNLGLVGRQVSYDGTRVAAASTAPATVAALHDLSGVSAEDLEIQDTSGQHEVGFNEPLNPDLNLVIESY
jgi:hypothetical protein